MEQYVVGTFDYSRKKAKIIAMFTDQTQAKLYGESLDLFGRKVVFLHSNARTEYYGEDRTGCKLWQLYEDAAVYDPAEEVVLPLDSYFEGGTKTKESKQTLVQLIRKATAEAFPALAQ